MKSLTLIKYVGIMLLSALALFSCERRELTYSMESEITITADWSRSGTGEKEQGYGATVIFYPAEGGEKTVVPMGNRDRQTVRLPEGRYNAVIFNRSFEDFDGISFRGTEDYLRLEACYKKTASGGESPAELTDGLSADRMKDFEVTPEMLGNYSTSLASRSGSKVPESGCLLSFHPAALMKRVTVKVHIKGLNNIRTATCTMDGLSESVSLATGTPSPVAVTRTFALANPVFSEGSTREGTLTATLNVFGFAGDGAHNLRLDALLADGKTTYTAEFDDVTLDPSQDTDGTVTVTIRLESEEPVPDVVPEGSSDSGFNVETESWGKEENSEITID